jgi:hypothetical protein
MGWFGGEMSLPSKLLRNDALLLPVSDWRSHGVPAEVEDFHDSL